MSTPTTLIPKVTTEDIRLSLNGTTTGSNYYFWGVSLSSGSVLAQINLANIYLYGILGSEVMDSTSQITYYHVRACELDYSCLRVLTLLSGDVITDGFSFTAGVTIQQPLLLATYRNLQMGFRDSAIAHLKSIQPLHVAMEADATSFSSTAPSMF